MHHISNGHLVGRFLSIAKLVLDITVQGIAGCCIADLTGGDVSEEKKISFVVTTSSPHFSPLISYSGIRSRSNDLTIVSVVLLLPE